MRRVVVVLSVLFLLPSPLNAQSPQSVPPASSPNQAIGSFNDIPRILKKGDGVWVTDTHGANIAGRFLWIERNEIAVDSPDSPGLPVVVPAQRVQEVRSPGPSKVKAGALIGLAGGFVLGYAGCAPQTGIVGGPRFGVVCGALFGGIGAGAGAMVGSMIHRNSVVVYRRGPASAEIGLTFAPILTQQKRGVALTFAF